MKLLAERIRIARRFQRSVRIDSDVADPKALDGFICPRSSAEVLLSMAKHVFETRQGAYTWTGPYGSGKSSLIIAVSALLNGDPELQRRASKIFGKTLTNAVWGALPLGTKGWRIVPVVGRRDNPTAVIGDALEEAGIVGRRPRGGWTEQNLIAALLTAASERPRQYGGIVLFIDEMGKFLEAAAHDNNDIYVFQQLAEAASRSNGRFLLIGVLHQAFEEYAHRVSHEVRDEWSKIQGRFLDLAISTAPEEQVELISRAIESDHAIDKPSAQAITVARKVCGARSHDAERMAKLFESCWPLHSTVAGLLGPISRRRFGQNQRSIFGFLNSSEPHGFQYFIRSTGEDEIYGPDRLWDYLRANLEPSILASPDGHRWALAADALERCEANGGDALHTRLLKTIAIIDLFKERSGLTASLDLLSACLPDIPLKTLKKALARLSEWSLINFKKFLDAYAVFAGSDFDVEQAIKAALDDVEGINFASLKELASLQPILAKRHYHETGTLRWFDIDLTTVRDVVETVQRYQPQNGTMGQFLLVIPTEGESAEKAAECCRKAVREDRAWDVVVGLSDRSWAVVSLARELLAVEKVRHDRIELVGDSVARREVNARVSALQSLLESELRRTLDLAVWYRKRAAEPTHYRYADLNGLASELADRRFRSSPKLHNELLNRQKPSSNAIAAQNELLRRMVLREGEHRLGIKGFPAEGGLFASLLEGTGLYSERDGRWQFVVPGEFGPDPSDLKPMWDAATAYMMAAEHRAVPVSELNVLWAKEPYGVKPGLMPVLSVAFILSLKNQLALYRNGVFRAKFDGVDVEYLAKDAAVLQLRWMSLSEGARTLLSSMAEIVRELDQHNALVHLEPIDVAKGLVALYQGLPNWTKRTSRLSSNAIRIRELFKRAQDPHKFLFDDIPTGLGNADAVDTSGAIEHVVSAVREGLRELLEAYPGMLFRLRDELLAELQVPNSSPQALAELRARAENIRQLAGDFRLEALIGRLSHYDGSETAFESIASLAADKPPREWVDPDLDRAAIDLAEMAQKFLRAETFARVKGRPEKRQAMAVVIGINGRPAPILKEFDLADSDRVAVDEVVGRVVAALESADTKRRTVILAALAELSVRYMREAEAIALPEREASVR
jgi:hypothetical protein